MLSTVILVVPWHTMLFLYSLRQILKLWITENITECIVFIITLIIISNSMEQAYTYLWNKYLVNWTSNLPFHLCETRSLSAAASFYPQPHETNTHPRTHLSNIYVTGLRYYLVGLNLVSRVLTFFQVLWININTQLTQTCYMLHPSHKFRFYRPNNVW
jgi:hypothetical protein